VNGIRKNKLAVIIVIIYLALFLWMPDKAIKAMGNSVYYLIEMFQVLPVIFLLTVVIEALIPKEMIMKHFGEDSGFIGSIFALLLGSISAGPIYAAFPICKMLLKKGASVPNVIIILSAWAVIKLPMLANEAKFLGLNFMVIRWVLTVIAILIMAFIAGKLIDRNDLISENQTISEEVVAVKQAYCVGCGLCAKMLPEVFKMVNKKALVSLESINCENEKQVNMVSEKCPVQAIIYPFTRYQ
jgi:uncharacterized membrane protein YraQ (UPF0718 family)